MTEWSADHQSWYDLGREHGLEDRPRPFVPAAFSGIYNAGRIHGHNDKLDGNAVASLKVLKK